MRCPANHSAQSAQLEGPQLEGTASTDWTSAVGAAGASNGTGLGLRYQFEY